jgi:AraC family transcriptional regulator
VGRAAARSAAPNKEMVLNNIPTMRALDAFSRAFNTAPVLANTGIAWGGITVCDWRLPWIEGFDLEENDDFIIAYHSAGSRRVRAACNGPWSDATSVPGMISVIPPGRRVEYRIEGQVCFCSVHVPKSLLNGLLASAFHGMPNFRFAFEDLFAHSCIEILLNHARSKQFCNFPYVHSVTRALILHLMEMCPLEQPRSAMPDDEKSDESGVKLDAMLDFIDSRLSEPLTLDDLAGEVAVSRAHFVRRFRAVTGMSPHRYVILRRIEKAKQLLYDSSMSIVQIALNVGFSSQSHFAQAFHMATGQTPSQFRGSRDCQSPATRRG